MTLQIINPKWLASPEGKKWAKELRKRNDEIIVEVFNEIFNERKIPLKDKN